MFGLLRGIVNGIKDRSTAKASILILGIDGAGKTTLVESLMANAYPDRRPKTIRPTNGLNTETISSGNVSLRFWDLGGAESFRSIWQNYLTDATAVLYVVNGRQLDRTHESRKLFDDVSMQFHRQMAVVFVQADRQILDLFPVVGRAAVFFIELGKPEDIHALYSWIRSTAVRGGD
jgi:small GTP-binding protein